MENLPSISSDLERSDIFGFAIEIVKNLLTNSPSVD